MKDANIIALYFSRSEEAIKQTQASYGRPLTNLAYNILRSEEDAEESVNDTYLRAWNTIPPERPQFFFAYLARICRNLSLDRLDYRSSRKRCGEMVALTEELEQCIPSNGREYEQAELSRVLNGFLKQLTPENRSLFLRRYWFGDSVGELSKRSGIREGTLNTRLFRLRAQLANYLQKEDIYL